MKHPRIAATSVGVIAVGALTLIAIDMPGTRKVDPPAPRAAPSAAGVSGNGFTLASTTVDLPIDEQLYPAGPHADVVNANCTGCHSASMALTQPSLTADQWKAEVTKMREVYKAPIADRDVAAILTYLTAMGAPPAAGDPPKSGADRGGSTG